MSPLAVLPAFAACAALVWSRRYPMVVLSVAVTLRIALTAGVGDEFALLPAVLVALFVAARSGSRRSSLIVASAAAVIMALAVAALDQGEPFLNELASELAMGLLPVAVADAVRSRADRVRDLIEVEAEARLQVEWLRIARDLHDVVAHGLSVIAVQSGVAAHLFDRDPDQARASLEVINRTGKRSLEELRTMVGVLRSTDEAPLMPAPTDPNDLSAIVESAGGAGPGSTEVNIEVEGGFPDDASEASVIAVHRILAEAVTNAARHGRGPARIRLRHQTECVTLTVTNRLVDTTDPTDARVPDRGSTGVGIVGMTERAVAMGGSLSAGPTGDGRFTVEATIPYRTGTP